MSISINDYAFIDFETQSLNPRMNQPISMACVIIDGRRLKIKDNGIFYSTMNIIHDDDVYLYKLNPIEQAALDKNKITLEQIKKSMPLRAVWNNFKVFLEFHNPSRNKWDAPIFSGHNSAYDYEIFQRISEGHLTFPNILTSKIMTNKTMTTMEDYEIAKAYKQLKNSKEPWKFGGASLIHPSKRIDTLQLAHMWFESLREPHSMSLDSIKEFLGFPEDMAHNALVDVLYTAEFFIRALKIQRSVSLDTDFDTGGETHLDIEGVLKSTLKEG